MNKRSKIGLASLAAAIIVSGGLFANGTLAAENNSDSEPIPNLVEKIATKFNLNKADVQQVFNEQHSTMHNKRMEKMSERITKAVADGKITAEQQTLITNKLAEIHTRMEEIRNLTDSTERKTAIDTLRSDTKTWAKENNINPKWLHLDGGHHKGHMLKHMSDAKTN